MDFFANAIGLLVGAPAVLAIGAAVRAVRARQDAETAGFVGPNGRAGLGVGALQSHCLHTYFAIPGGNQLGATSIWYDPELLSVRLEYADVQRVRKVADHGMIEVWDGRHHGERVTIRWLADAHKTMDNAVAMAMEVKTMVRLEHSSIVRFVGVAWSSALRVQALSEHMDGGDLDTWLQTQNPAQLTWAGHKCQLAKDLTEALVYLHAANASTAFVHRDITSSSVLVDSQKGTKLSGFSYSRINSNDANSSTIVSDKLWLAPEVMMGERLTEYADVYAFGLVLAQLDTHKHPFEDTGRGQVETLLLIATGKVTPTLSRNCPTQVREFVRCCLAFDPLARPRVADLWDRLDKIHKELP